MKEKIDYQKAVIEGIKQKVMVLNSIFVLITFVILLLTVRFMYKFLDYIPFSSVMTMLVVMAVFMAAGLLLIKTISRNAIKAIDAYSNKLNTLLTTSKNIHEIVYSDILLEKIVDVSQKITGADGGSLALLQGDKFVFKAVKGDKIDSLPEITISNCVGIMGWAIDNSKVIRADDTKQDIRFYPEIDEVTGYRTRSVLCVPLKLSSGVIGALELVSEKNGAFNKEDEEIISYFADQAALSIEKAKLYEDEKNFKIHLTNILSNICDKMAEKKGHSKRIAKYTLLMAQAMNMPENEQKKLYNASLLHDIGFLNIRPEDILSIDDYRSHSQVGYEMLKPITFYDDISPIILHHHEWYDGKGYPSGLKGDAIPIGSRMIAIAEAFDAMVSKDSYKCTGKIINREVIPHIVEIGGAIEELKRNANTQFDPKLVEVFVKNISEDYLE
jgi:HD-GYP domain-containing protein (c-di-GMP phosphodiesterase class II)